LPPLSAGESFPELSLVSLGGERMELRTSESSRKILLYIFSPRCSVCHENIPAWRELFDVANSESVEVVGISVLNPGQTAAYVRQYDIPWNVFCLADRASLQALRVRLVPLTMLVSDTGSVALTMTGRISSEQKIEISRHLDRTS
jgi:peroxiredoxin